MRLILHIYTNKIVVRIKNGELYLFLISFSLLISFPFIFILGARIRDLHNSVLYINYCYTVLKQIHGYLG